MSPEVITISGMANSYLVNTDDGNFILIDTGFFLDRRVIVRGLDVAGCGPENLKLIILTHGDMDHSGNGAFLRRKFGVKIAMHRGDAGMVEHGDMSWNRKTSKFIKFLFNLPLVRLSASNRFTPDFYLEDGQDLSAFGMPGTRILHLPGHSSGSISILTADGELFCGDLLINNVTPALNSIIDDLPAAKASLERLKGLSVGTVYPGHGKPFQFDQLSNI